MINLNAGINKTGYGCVATNIFKSLWARDNKLTLFPIGGVDLDDDSWGKNIRIAIQNQDNYDASKPSLKIWHQNDLASRYSNVFNSALTFFETSSLNNREIQHINSLDMLFVASEWAKKIVDTECTTECVVLPMGVDHSLFRPISQPRAEDEPYRFFTTGKTEIRKGHDILIDLFCNTFNEDDNVELYIKWDNPFLSNEERTTWERLYAQSKLGNKIHFVSTQTHKNVAEFISQCDCGIFPFRSEGFGLGILESIASGKPVIATNYSGPTEFLNGRNSLTVTPTSLTEAYDGKWFFGESKWAELGEVQLKEFREHMRNCYDNKIYELEDSALPFNDWDICSNILMNHIPKY